MGACPTYTTHLHWPYHGVSYLLTVFKLPWCGTVPTGISLTVQLSLEGFTTYFQTAFCYDNYAHNYGGPVVLNVGVSTGQLQLRVKKLSSLAVQHTFSDSSKVRNSGV